VAGPEGIPWAKLLKKLAEYRKSEDGEGGEWAECREKSCGLRVVSGKGVVVGEAKGRASGVGRRA